MHLHCFLVVHIAMLDNPLIYKRIEHTEAQTCPFKEQV